MNFTRVCRHNGTIDVMGWYAFADDIRAVVTKCELPNVFIKLLKCKKCRFICHVMMMIHSFSKRSDSRCQRAVQETLSF